MAFVIKALKYFFWIDSGNFSVPAIKKIIHKKGYFLVQGIPGNIKPDNFVDQYVRFGIGADTNTEPAVRPDCFPIGEAFFLKYGPVPDMSAVRFVPVGNGA